MRTPAEAIAPTTKVQSGGRDFDHDTYEDQNYFVMVDCPEHLTHKVKLFTFPHRYAGIWECNVSHEAISGPCSHFDTTVESDDISQQINVCVLCQVTVGTTT